ncbi:MAG: type 4a pilus biogenesis protein PilO [Actinobacteria bacterium]|nr:type 4a pilus biogenesis protein PilO [Actinomycetota bacterium]
MRNSRTLIAAVAGGLVVVVLAWYIAVYRPKASQITDARQQVEEAQGEEQNLRATLERLESVDAERPEFEAEVRRLAAAIPPQPELASFILAAHNLAARSELAWLSISPTLPASLAGTDISQVSMEMELAGEFFDVVKYLQGIEELERIVVIDSLELTAEEVEEQEEQGAGSSALGATGTSRGSQPLTLSGGDGDGRYEVTTDVATIGTASPSPSSSSTPTTTAVTGGPAQATTVRPTPVVPATSRIVRVTLTARAFTTAPPVGDAGATATTTTTAPAATTTTGGG